MSAFTRIEAAEDSDFRLRLAGLEDDRPAARIDFAAIWSALYRSRALIAALMAAALLAGVGSILIAQKSYRAQASVQIDPQSARVLDTQDAEPVFSGPEVERLIRTQAEILRTRALAQSVAQAMSLSLDDDILTDGAPAGSPPAAAVVEAVQENLDTEILPNSRLVRISFEHRDPALAAAIANGFADELLKANLRRKVDTSAYSGQFLETRLAEAKRRLEDAERAAIAYARSAQLIDASAGAARGERTGPSSLTTSSLVELNLAYSAARSARVAAEQKWRQLQSAGAMSLPEVLGNGAIQQMTQRRAELQSQYQDELEHRREDHPSVRQLAARIAETNRQIGGLAGSVRSSIRDQYLVAQRQEAALLANVAQLKSATLDEQDRGVRYTILRRDVDTSRQLYDGLLQRFKEVSAAAGISSNNISIVDRAWPPSDPVSPRVPVNMVLAFLVGLALSLIAVFVREMVVDRIRDPEDVIRKLKLAVLGIIPALPKGKNPLQALRDPRSPISEAHNSLQTSLQFASPHGAPASILVTSSRPSEGKSTSALAIAIGFALEGKSVLLVDADLRRPTLHASLKLNNAIGLVHLLTGKKAVDEAVQKTGLANLSFIASGPVPPSPAELLAGPRLNSVLAELNRAYEMVIIDGPPVLGLADAPRLAAAAAGTIFVVRSDGIQGRAAQRALARLTAGRAMILGAVLTRYDASKSGLASEYDEEYYAYGQAAAPA